jgi:hypothetical protein
MEPAAVESATMEPAAMEPAAMEPAAMEPAAMEPAAVAAPAMAAPATRLGRNWLGDCKNAHQSSRSDTQAAPDADPFHADLLLSLSPHASRLLRIDLGPPCGIRLARR